MLTYPKISIVTPSYNQGQYIEDTILSVLEQNYPNLEYIIIDGKSTDNTVEIIKKYEQHLAYWVSEKDGGMYEAIQKGFERSTGEIMAWINSDDMYHRNAFFVMAKVLNDLPEVAWVQGIPTGYSESGMVTSVRNLRRWSKYNFLLREFQEWVQQESTFWRRSLWEKAGSYVDSELKYAGDFELWVRFMKHEKLYSLNALIGGFRGRTKNQLSKELYPKYLKEADNVMNSQTIDKSIQVQMNKIIRQQRTLDLLKKIKLDILRVKEKLVTLYEFPPKIKPVQDKFVLDGKYDLTSFYPHEL